MRTFSALQGMAFSLAWYAAAASRSSGMPGPGTYLVFPSSSAFFAASLMCLGVSKSGSPTLKETTSTPSRFFCATRLAMATVAEAVMRDIRGEKPGTRAARRRERKSPRDLSVVERKTRYRGCWARLLHALPPGRRPPRLRRGPRGGGAGRGLDSRPLVHRLRHPAGGWRPRGRVGVARPVERQHQRAPRLRGGRRSERRVGKEGRSRGSPYH